MTPRNHIRNFSVLFFFALFLNGVVAQDATGERTVHKLKGGIGYGTTKYFSGITGSFSYEAQRKHYFAAASLNHLVEFLALFDRPEKVTDYSLTLNRLFMVGSVELSIGTGVALVRHALYRSNFYTPQPGYLMPEPRFVKKRTFGVPADFQIGIRSGKFTASLALHANFNSLNSMYGCTVRLGRIFK